MNHKRIAVVGGGAAGLMAAIAAAEGGGQVTLLEPNDRLGKKLNITGKGRCNVTNNCSREELLRNIPRNGRFLYGAFARFDSRDAMAFFEKLGVPLKTERGNRVFPQSDCAFDVSGALRRRCERLGVKWVRDRAVSVETAEGRVCGVAGEKETYPAEAVVVTGMLGNLCAPLLVKLFRVKDPMAVGLGIGACSHAMGTAKALELGETEGAMSGLAIGLCGILTTVLALLADFFVI